ncbi:transcriptional activator domain-containing protein [Gemmatirosa kalamazoonensis]|uniref:Transcriptional activator domain-containing protein n=1 Tax=Gemmatirosa kalamazoonensis TaxID=861299 RepID=W0RC08_9BACT|nr:BTAD domain-containing putative transcriptional regulator [Gemmatirosa kalamazoonensis]AHG87850.1 transcriptional activator domain-containing protein [Gemmatirosa kalamazoonensis]
MSNALRLRTFGGLSIDRPGGDADVGARPRTLALLAILAAAGARGLPRERAMAVLWPDADEDRARHALSQALYNLRRDLRGDVVLAAPTLRLDPARITSDVAELRDAVAAKEWDVAAGLYVGPFLDGFQLADAPEFERWAEAERASLATAGIRAIEIVAKACAEAGRLDEAAEHWHRLTRLDPADPRLAASYMEALAALGDRAAALAHGRAHAELLRRDYEAEPHSAIARLMTRLRELHVTGAHAAVASPPATTVYAPPAPAEVEEPPDVPPTAPPAAPPNAPRRRASHMTVAASVVAVAVLAVLAALGWRWAAATRAPARPILAVGRIHDLAAPDSAAPGAVLSEMLATSLGRLSDLQVVANSRMVELTPRDADTTRTAFTDAARRAGATEIVEGELIPLSGGKLRLEVRRVDLARGLVRGGYRVAGVDRFALFDSVTALIALDLEVGAPNGSLAEVSTRSPLAYRLYEEGLRALYQYDAGAAYRLFTAAIREDSSFAMATYYAWRVAQGSDDAAAWPLADRALALSSRATPHDRLIIVTHLGGVLSDPRARATAETLATSYPRDPEALVRAADVTTDLPRAVELYDRSIALDSAAGLGRDAATPCRLCDALHNLTGRYEAEDSSDAVFRTLARWRAIRPTDPMPWRVMADWLVGFGRRAEADEAARRAEALGSPTVRSRLGDLVTAIRLDDLPAADSACTTGLPTSDSAAFGQFRWYCAIALRMEGRYREARALMHEGLLPRSTVVRSRWPADPYAQAIVDLEAGYPLLAAREFHAIYRPDMDPDARPSRAGHRARYAAWVLALTATAAVAGGDTLQARHLVDSIQYYGRRSLFPRDPPLHHFVRGLLESRAGREESAVRELRAAMSSPTFGYSRINYELGRGLLALGRPADAIGVVQASLHGGFEGPGLYVTRTELHELLARLFDAAGRTDSAAVHYAAVERAWRSADPFLRPRYDAARRWLAAQR